MSKKIITLMVIASAIFANMFAAPVESNIAEKIAKNWYGNFSDRGESAVEKTIELKYNNETTIFVFTMKNGGFVMVAADDASIPVLGYSLTDNFDEAGNNLQSNYWYTQYHKQIAEIRELNLSNSKTLSKWNNILENNLEKGVRDVEPLVQDTWNQGSPYNNYCPEDEDGKAVTGCVATAMSMILHTNQHPTHGDGSSSYNWWNGSSWENLAADYGSTIYDWDLMPTSVSSGNSSEEIHQVATINYHAGVSVEMGYGSDGSGAYSEDVPVALRTYFGYSNAANLKSRTSYSLTNWQNMLKTEFDAGRPVYYAGRSDEGGHAFICDGYQLAGSMFHFNFGWGGSSNGYYAIDALNTGNGSYNTDQRMINNIIPVEEDLIVTEDIEDMILSENTYVINLNDHFESIGGSSISYSVGSNSNTGAVTTSINGSNLTLTKGSDGIATIKINASTSTESFFNIFDVRVIPKAPLSGYGNTYDFASSSYIEAGNAAVLNNMEKLTVSAWVKLNTLGVNHSVISKNTSTNNGWYFNINTVNKIKFYIKGDGGDTRKLYSTSTIPENEWVHLAGTYDGQIQKIYINGVVDKQEDHGDIQGIAHMEDQNLMIGKSVSYYTDGSLDDVRLWNKGLSQLEIIESMGNELSGTETDLVGYWKIDENIGGAIADLTGNNNGTMRGLNNANWAFSTAPARYCSHGSTVTGVLPGTKDGSISYELVNNAGGSITITNSATGEFSANAGSGIVEFTYKIVEDGNSSEIIDGIIDNDLVDIDDEVLAKSVTLSQNYPNPFNPETMIKYHINKMSDVKISVFNSKGQFVWNSVKSNIAKGSYSVSFDGKALNSGVYYYQLEVNGVVADTKKMILVK